MVRGIPQFIVRKGDVCDACSMGKNHMDPFFLDDEKPIRNILNNVHSNVC